MIYRSWWVRLILAATMLAGASPLRASAQVCGFVSVGPEGAETDLHAANFRNARQARRWARQFGDEARLEILRGACSGQSDLCPLIDAPVCGVLNLSAERTFGNMCQLQVATLDAAGDALRADAGILHTGVCEQECASSDECNEGEYCTTDDGDCNPPPGCEPGATCIDLCYGVCAPEPPGACDGKACGEACSLDEGDATSAYCFPDGQCRARSEPPACDFFDCDTTHAACRRLPPECPEGQTASIEGLCYGPCVPIEQCGCTPEEPTACPEDYVCWAFAGHCGPFVN